MHAGICPTGACDIDLFLYQILNGLLQDGLDRHAVRLDLPAYIIRSVVGNRKTNPMITLILFHELLSFLIMSPAHSFILQDWF